MNTLKFTFIIAILSAALGAGYGFYHKQTTEQDQSSTQTIALDHLPDFNFPDLQGNSRSSKEWQHKIVVLNFWATWCPPCRKEMPSFVEVQKKYPEQVQFIGIAVDDKEAVQTFVNSYKINFPTLLGNMNAIDLSKQLGNRFSGLPFTAIFNKNGDLKFHQTGELKQAVLEKELNKLF